jgi:hypothetical protein
VEESKAVLGDFLHCEILVDIRTLRLFDPTELEHANLEENVGGAPGFVEPTGRDQSESSAAQASRTAAQSRLGASSNCLQPQIGLTEAGGVHLDPFHFEDRILKWMDKGHPFFYQFTQCLRDVVFIIHPLDKKNVEEALALRGLEFEKEYHKNPGKLLRFLRRTIPPPAELEARLLDLRTIFLDKLDKDRKSLFTEKVDRAFQNCLVHVQKGCVSDPVNACLYFEVGIDKDLRLVVYRCVRGTNAIEGLFNYPVL